MKQEWNGNEINPLQIVFRGPVRSGFFTFLGQTGTGTGPKFTQIHSIQTKTSQNRFGPVIEHFLILKI
jgi:hypothetical protein